MSHCILLQNPSNLSEKKFEIKFKTSKSPSKTRIHAWVLKLQAHGSVENLNAKSPARVSHSGRPMSARTPENVAAVKMSVDENPTLSSRQRSQVLGLSHRSLGNPPRTFRLLCCCVKKQ